MIQGISALVYDYNIYRLTAHSIATVAGHGGNKEKVKAPPIFISKGIRDKLELQDQQTISYVNPILNKITKEQKEIQPDLVGRIDFNHTVPTYPIHTDINLVEGLGLVDGNLLNIEAFRKWRPEYENAVFITEEDGKYICGNQVEKMSKRLYNVVNPDDIVNRYGADTLRMYEMFLGPLTDSKPWNTNGISGVHNFLRKYWRLMHDERTNQFNVSNAEPTREELKALHKLIKKVADDIESLSLNTSVSAFMVCVNELTSLKCNKQAILSDLTVVLSSYAPHIAEEIWHLLGNTTSVTQAPYPAYNESYLIESAFEYPISINGKVRAKMTFSVDTAPAEIEKVVLESEAVQKWLEGKPPKKIIVVPKRIVNVVV